MKIPTSKVKSSQIAEIGHDGNSMMAVKFHSGFIYHYPGVTSEQFENFKNSESIGKHFAQHYKYKLFIRS